MKKRLTIEEIHTLAKSRNGKCLSEKYVNNNIKLFWECQEGHRWEAAFRDIKAGTWCSVCARKKKLTIEKMQEVAKSKGGKCLSEKYTNIKTKLKWECQEGYSWEATYNDVRRGQWCPHCSGNAKLTIEEMQEIAKSKGGKCISEKYFDTGTKLLWECSKEHRWEATPGNVKSFGQWCPYCAGNTRCTIEEMHEIAKSKNGKCLSEKYINNSTKLQWECQEGHRWDATPKNIKKGKWCPVCARKRFSKKRQSNRPARPGKSK